MISINGIDIQLDQLAYNQQLMFTSKISNKTQTQLASIALIHVLKSVAGLVACLMLYYYSHHMVILTIGTLPFLYFTFIAIEEKAFIVLWSYFQRLRKYKKLHAFFEQVEASQSNFPLMEFFTQSNSQSRKKKRDRVELDTEQTEQQQSKITKKKDIYIPASKQKSAQSQSKPLLNKKQLNKQQYEQKYLKIRQAYKKSLQVVKKQMQQFANLTKTTQTTYKQRIQKLFQVDKDNMARMKAQLEKHYRVHILQNEDSEKSLKLINLTIDEAIFRIRRFKNKLCLPWGQRMDWDPIQIKKHHDSILEIARQRSLIDNVLAPDYILTHELRMKNMQAIKNQLESNVAGVELVYTVAQIYNNSNILQLKYKLSKEGKAEQGLQIVQSRIGNRLHVDLRIKRKEKGEVLVCLPGINNLWTLITLAQQISYMKL